MPVCQLQPISTLCILTFIYTLNNLLLVFYYELGYFQVDIVTKSQLHKHLFYLLSFCVIANTF